MTNNLSLISVKFDFTTSLIFFSVLGIEINEITPDKKATTFSLMIILHAIRSQDPEVSYIKHLKSIPFEKLGDDQLGDIILGSIMMFS
jgi:hypothetical protein